MRVEQPIDQMVEDQYKSFTNQQILKYHEDNLEKVNAEYAHVLAEYRDGLLLFDLMQEKVWNAVQKDTMAIETYYNKNKAKYTWPERIDAVIATGSDPKIIAQVKRTPGCHD